MKSTAGSPPVILEMCPKYVLCEINLLWNGGQTVLRKIGQYVRPFDTAEFAQHKNQGWWLSWVKHVWKSNRSQWWGLDNNLRLCHSMMSYYVLFTPEKLKRLMCGIVCAWAPHWELGSVSCCQRKDDKSSRSTNWARKDQITAAQNSMMEVQGRDICILLPVGFSSQTFGLS